MDNRPPPLPSLDFFKGFEAAARHLSFTKAAEELFVTQSAVSRQIQALEQRLGVALFVRRNRGLVLTEAGEQMWRAVTSALRILHQAVDQVSPGATPKLVTVTSSMAFSSLWLIPRLTGFRRLHPDLDVRIAANNKVLDLDREHIDLAIRYCPSRAAPAGSARLFGEEILPVCSPVLMRDRDRPLKTPQDLRHHVLLHYDEPQRPAPWLTWNVWLEVAGVPDLVPADSLRFNHYDQTIGAALGGQGVALGRRPLLKKLLADGALVAPFPLGSVTDRAYFIVRTPATAGRPEVAQFVEWLVAEAAAMAVKDGETGIAKRRRSRKK